MMRRTPLKRTGPIKKRSKPKPKLERDYHGLVAAMSCLVCGAWPVTLHHVTAAPYAGRLARSDRRVVPLCAKHHLIQHGPRESVEALGHTGFYETYGLDLLAIADRLWLDLADYAS
jgi:hypothetical protein